MVRAGAVTAVLHQGEPVTTLSAQWTLVIRGCVCVFIINIPSIDTTNLQKGLGREPRIVGGGVSYLGHCGTPSVRLFPHWMRRLQETRTKSLIQINTADYSHGAVSDLTPPPLAAAGSGMRPHQERTAWPGSGVCFFSSSPIGWLLDCAGRRLCGGREGTGGESTWPTHTGAANPPLKPDIAPV